MPIVTFAHRLIAATM